MEKTTILLISADTEYGLLLTEYLSARKDFNFDWKYIRQFEEALSYLKKNPSDVILLDVTGVAKEKSLEGVAKLYNQAPGAVIIVLTDEGKDETVFKFAEHGAQECFIKSQLNGSDFFRSVFLSLKRKHLEEQQRQKITDIGKQAQLATQAKTEFLAKMSHEIRNPLNAMLGFSSLLQKSRLNPKQKEQLETVISCGNLLLGICDDMLDISKIEAGQIKLDISDFDLLRLIEEVFKMVRTRLADKPVKLYFEIETDVPTDLQGDSRRLRQILINLLNNAVKFTDHGEVSLHVSVDKNNRSKDPRRHLLKFSVKDTGIGIPADKTESIFNLFVQADYSKSHQQDGTGLGLAISKAFVEAMGGKIRAESKIGEGSEFIFTAFFQEKELTPPEAPRRKVGQEAITRRNLAEKMNCKGIRVLVAEDGIPSQELMKAYFDYLGCKADYVSDGQQAIEKLEHQPYDICLMDMGMPILDGVEATKIIRKKISKDIPIIALTAAAMKKDREKCLEAGMNDYIKKPVDVVKLKEKILLYTKLKKT